MLAVPYHKHQVNILPPPNPSFKRNSNPESEEYPNMMINSISVWIWVDIQSIQQMNFTQHIPKWLLINPFAQAIRNLTKQLLNWLRSTLWIIALRIAYAMSVIVVGIYASSTISSLTWPKTQFIKKIMKGNQLLQVRSLLQRNTISLKDHIWIWTQPSV